MTLPAFICPCCHTLVSNKELCPYDGTEPISSSLRTDFAADDLVGRAILPEHTGEDGKYHIVQLLGQGGFGRVYLGWSNELQRTVAIKVYQHNCTYKDVEPMAARIQHPNVIHIYDAGRLDEYRRYIIQEHLRGKTLEDIEALQLSPSQAVDYIRQACRGLHAAHLAGVVHRDIKPSNLFLHHPWSAGAPRNNQAVIKVIDFGALHKMANSQAQIIGTPEFAAPEQYFSHTTLDARTDVYALGITLYFLLTRRYPFEQSRAPDTHPVSVFELQKEAMMSQEPPTVRDLVPEISTGLSDIVMKAISRSMDKRFPTMEAFERALALVQESDGVVDLDEVFSKKLDHVDHHKNVSIIYIDRMKDPVPLSLAGLEDPLMIGYDKVIHINGRRLRRQGKAHNNLTSIPESMYIASLTRQTICIETRHGECLKLFEVHNASQVVADKILMDMGQLGKFRASIRYKDRVSAILDPDTAHTTIVCFAH